MISYMISYILWYHMHYHTWYHTKTYDIIMYDIILTCFLRYYDIVIKIWYHTWYHIAFMISCMISYLLTISWSFTRFLRYLFCDIAYDIIYISYDICYDISMLWYYSWHQSIYAMIRPSDISMSWYHSHVISRISRYVPLYHGTCQAVWRWLGPQLGGASRQALHLLWPRHRQRARKSVGTVVHLNSDGLDPAHGLIAVAAAKFQVQGVNFQVGRNFKFELINCCPSLAHMQSFSPSWPLGSCRLAALCSGLGHRQSQRSALESAGQIRIHCQSGSSWFPLWLKDGKLCTSVVSLSSCTSLHKR